MRKFDIKFNVLEADEEEICLDFVCVSKNTGREFWIFISIYEDTKEPIIKEYDSQEKRLVVIVDEEVYEKIKADYYQGIADESDEEHVLEYYIKFDTKCLFDIPTNLEVLLTFVVISEEGEEFWLFEKYSNIDCEDETYTPEDDEPSHLLIRKHCKDEFEDIDYTDCEELVDYYNQLIIHVCE